MKQVINISQSQNITINPPTQQELNLESITENVGLKVKPSEKEYLEQLARDRGVSTSTLVRKIVFAYLKAYPHIKSIEAIMDEILI